MTSSIGARSYVIKRVRWYLLAFAGVWYCGINFNSGPCTPNLNIFFWLLTTLISLVLLLKDVVQLAVLKDKKKVYSISIHAIAFLLLCAWGSI